MEPNFQTGEYLLIDELSYDFRDAKRGEVIVFHYPLDTSKYYIKRVIGLPNETIEIKNGKITIYNSSSQNGFLVVENYIPSNFTTEGDIKKKLGKDEYFVLGDNRPYSSDSRRWGVLPKSDIVGRAWIRAWPIAKTAVFEAPVY